MGIGGHDIRDDVRIDQDHQSPRVRDISSSVVIPVLACPRKRAKRPLVPPSTLFRMTLPSASRSNSTRLPGRMPRRSRMLFGLVTCPLVVTAVAIAHSIEYYKISNKVIQVGTILKVRAP